MLETSSVSALLLPRFGRGFGGLIQVWDTEESEKDEVELTL